MKAVIQRVTGASVSVGGHLRGSISSGLLVYLGVALEDTEADADWIAEKTAHLRIFHDDDGKMNRSLMDINNALRDTDGAKGADGGKQEQAGVLAVSQFTLLGDARKGRRPSWGKAAAPDEAKRLYEYFIRKIREQGLVCETGEFQAHMQVSYTNDGPVTILLDSRD